MVRYVIQRVGHGMLVLLCIILFVFFAVRATGDPAMAILGQGNPTAEAVVKLRHALDLDRPIYVQLLLFLRKLVTGDLGVSFRNGQPVMPQIMERMPATLVLASASMAVAVVIAVPLGVLSAVHRGRWVDLLARILALVGISFPSFWLGIMFILILSVKLRWFPASGYRGPHSLVLPSLTLGLILASILTRLVRSTMLEVLRAQYIQTARAKGLNERVVILRHALRNALVPVVTYMGLQVGGLLGGTVILEEVFAWPGLGKLTLDSVQYRDFPMIQASVLVLAVMMVVVNLVVDLLYGVLDPRIRLGR